MESPEADWGDCPVNQEGSIDDVLIALTLGILGRLQLNVVQQCRHEGEEQERKAQYQDQAHPDKGKQRTARSGSSRPLFALVGVGLILVLSLPFLLFAFVTTLLNHIQLQPAQDS